MPDSTPDELATELEAIKKHQAARKQHGIGFEDERRLLAAVEAVLKEHQPVNRGEGLEPICGTCHKGFWPCDTYRAITRELTGKGSSNGE